MLTFFVVLQIIVAVFLILVVLLQPGNRGGVSAALGGAGGDTVFGGRGANTFLAKLTFIAATLFMVTNLALSFMSSETGSVLDRVKAPVKSAQDAAEPAAGELEVPAPTEGEAPVDAPAENVGGTENK